MRIRALALIFFVLSAPAARAEAWADKMLKDGTSHDFGSVPHGSVLYHRFTVTNVFAVPLKITAVKSGCICGTVTSSTAAIEPNKTGWVDVTMDARKFTGAKTISVYVTVGDDDHTSTAEIKISATSRTDVVFNPGQVSFGAVPAGETPTKTIDVEYAGTLPWKVTDVVTNGAPVEASFKEMYRRPGEVGYKITVTLKPDAPGGALKRELFLKTNDPASPLVAMVVDASIQASVSVSPEKVSLSNVKAGEETLRRVVVRGTADKPFKILEVDGMGEGIETTATIPSEADTKHTITFKCKLDKEGDVKRKVKIKTDLSDKPLIVSIEGNVLP